MSQAAYPPPNSQNQVQNGPAPEARPVARAPMSVPRPAPVQPPNQAPIQPAMQSAAQVVSSTAVTRPQSVASPAQINEDAHLIAPAIAAPQIKAEDVPLELTQPAPAASVVRRSLVKRLADVICIPASQLTPQERHMAGDVLVEMLREADAELRENVAKRLVMLNEAPRTILLILAKDILPVARHVLENSKSLTDSDLIHIARNVSGEHRKMMALRRKVSDSVVDVMVEFSEEDVINTLLKNPGTNFSEKAIQRILTLSRNTPSYVAHLAKREETRPSHGLTMFWWADSGARKFILSRFAVTRNVLQETCQDLYAQAAAEGWNDAAVRKALQFIERRQRNRAAAERSPYENLEEAIEKAAQTGLTRELAEEISYMAGIKPATGAQIMTDVTGEGLAILCKAPGLGREYITKMWLALRRDTGTHDQPDPALANVISVYDAISTDKAQTVLRYWNWSLTSSLNEDVLRHIKNGVIPNESEFGAAAISAALVFGHRQA